MINKIKELVHLKLDVNKRKVYFIELIKKIHTENLNSHLDKMNQLYQACKLSLDDLSLLDSFKVLYDFDLEISEINVELSKKNLSFIFDNRREIATLSKADREWFLELIFEERKSSVEVIERTYENISKDFNKIIKSKETSIDEDEEYDLEDFFETSDDNTKKKKYQ